MKVIVFDVETTGLQRYDRIVSLAAVRIENGALARRALNLVFDPRKDSHPEALAIHGLDDWMLRHQDLFASLAPGIRLWFDWADQIVAHNVEFDSHYLQRELRKAEVPMLEKPFFCTLEAAREQWHLRSYRLDACAAHCGLPRRGKRHGALEDALLAAGLYLRLHGHEFEFPDGVDRLRPTNLRPCPPCPDGPLPRRSIKRPVPWPQAKA